MDIGLSERYAMYVASMGCEYPSKDMENNGTAEGFCQLRRSVNFFGFGFMISHHESQGFPLKRAIKALQTSWECVTVKSWPAPSTMIVFFCALSVMSEPIREE